MTKAVFITAADAFHDWRDGVLSGAPPVLYPIGVGDLARLEIGPGLVTLIGGPPGAGKTAFTMQALVDALRLTEGLRALVCNIEMSAAVLLDRQLARLSGISLSTIRHRQFNPEHGDRLDQALHTLEGLADRLCFVRPPFTLENVAAAADAFGADLLLLDYIQRIPPPGQHGDKRGAIDASMNYLRQFADAGIAVVVVAAVSRAKDGKGRSSYDRDGLNLASFRESSELEFGADDAFILTPDREGEAVTLRHLKARHSDPRDVALQFDRRLQHFTPTSTSARKARQSAVKPAGKTRPNLTAALAALWNRTDAATDDTKGADT